MHSGIRHMTLALLLAVLLVPFSVSVASAHGHTEVGVGKENTVVVFRKRWIARIFRIQHRKIDVHIIQAHRGSE